jgi:putative membrane protein
MTDSDRPGPPSTPWDSGLPNERTALGWIRVSLALLAAALIVVKAAAMTAPTLAVTLAVVSLLSVGYCLASGARRYRYSNRLLAAPAPLPDGKLPAVLAFFTAALGVCVLGFAFLG